MTPESLKRELGMSSREVDLLLADTVFNILNTEKWQYSNAWYPIEDGENYGKSQLQ